MITITIKIENKTINKIFFSGHAQPIVCAAISVLLPATLNYIYLLEQDTIDYIDENGQSIIQVLQNTQYNQMFLQQMIKMLEDIQEQYSQDIIIKEES